MTLRIPPIPPKLPQLVKTWQPVKQKKPVDGFQKALKEALERNKHE